MKINVALCIASLLVATVQGMTAPCPEMMGLTACTNIGSGGGDIAAQCAGIKETKCAAAILALLAKKDDAACKATAEPFEKMVAMCGCQQGLDAMQACKGLEDDSKNTAAKCAVLKETNCAAAVQALMANNDVNCKLPMQQYMGFETVCNGGGGAQCQEMQGLQVCQGLDDDSKDPAAKCAIMEETTCAAALQLILAKKDDANCKAGAEQVALHMWLCSGSTVAPGGGGDFLCKGAKEGMKSLEGLTPETVKDLPQDKVRPLCAMYKQMDATQLKALETCTEDVQKILRMAKNLCGGDGPQGLCREAMALAACDYENKDPAAQCAAMKEPNCAAAIQAILAKEDDVDCKAVAEQVGVHSSSCKCTEALDLMDKCKDVDEDSKDPAANCVIMKEPTCAGAIKRLLAKKDDVNCMGIAKSVDLMNGLCTGGGGDFLCKAAKEGMKSLEGLTPETAKDLPEDKVTALCGMYKQMDATQLKALETCTEDVQKILRMAKNLCGGDVCKVAKEGMTALTGLTLEQAKNLAQDKVATLCGMYKMMDAGKLEACSDDDIKKILPIAKSVCFCQTGKDMLKDLFGKTSDQAKQIDQDKRKRICSAYKSMEPQSLPVLEACSNDLKTALPNAKTLCPREFVDKDATVPPGKKKILRKYLIKQMVKRKRVKAMQKIKKDFTLAKYAAAKEKYEKAFKKQAGAVDTDTTVAYKQVPLITRRRLQAEGSSEADWSLAFANDDDATAGQAAVISDDFASNVGTEAGVDLVKATATTEVVDVEETVEEEKYELIDEVTTTTEVVDVEETVDSKTTTAKSDSETSKKAASTAACMASSVVAMIMSAAAVL